MNRLAKGIRISTILLLLFRKWLNKRIVSCSIVGYLPTKSAIENWNRFCITLWMTEQTRSHTQSHDWGECDNCIARKPLNNHMNRTRDKWTNTHTCSFISGKHKCHMQLVTGVLQSIYTRRLKIRDHSKSKKANKQNCTRSAENKTTQNDRLDASPCRTVRVCYLCIWQATRHSTRIFNYCIMEKKKWLTLAVIKRNTKRKFHLSAAVHLSLSHSLAHFQSQILHAPNI